MLDYERMKSDEFIVECAKYLVENKSTIRGTAKYMNISKSTLHKYLTNRLKYINFDLYVKAMNVIAYNKSVRHIRGGEATRNKYLKLKEQSKS